jgi:uncharacterized protein YgiM (DUF1202 family)
MDFKRIDRIVIIAVAAIFILWAISRCVRRGGTDDATITNTQNGGLGNTPAANVFIYVDSLKMRTGPNTDSAVVQILYKNEEITFTGERSSFTQTIKLEQIMTEPWLKVKTKQGKTGWVFGGGVRPYRR